jgi:stage II sporulation protein D
MKRILIIILMILTLTFLIPYFIISKFSVFYTPPGEKKAETFEKISVYIKSEDKVEKMDMSQYLKETVAAEMPAEFETEALKAQAVAARTYLVNRINAGNEQAKKDHKGADICTDSSHCKAWISENARRESWGAEKADEYWNKISNAVESTAGVLITYNNSPISAVFHSTSSGFTENAKDVWGGDVPYLVSVESKGEDQSPRYHSERTLTADEFKSTAESNLEGLNWDNGLIGDITRSDAGGIKTIVIGGVPVKGTKFRTMFELRSTNVNISEADGNILMQVTGYGHGVGMSQYGANYLASQGMNYIDILKTYYSGVEVS